MPANHRYGPYFTGALPHRRDRRDYRMEKIHPIANRLVPGAGPLPDACDLIKYIPGIEDQGAVSCCVMASTALMKGIFDEQGLGAYRFDFLDAYHALGGDDHEGIDSRLALDYAQHAGLRVVGGTARHRIGSYAFAPRDTPEGFVATLKASIVAGHPFVIACRLPMTFSWDSAGPRTDAYHQMCGVGFDPDHLIVANSWSESWGKQGLGRIPWAFLTADNWQGGDVYAWTAIDGLDDGLKPN